MPDPLSAAFSFQLIFKNEEYSFQEVSGISMDMESNEIPEGGENRFKHRLPSQPLQNHLVLKRGIVAAKSSLLSWVEQSIFEGLNAPITPHDLELNLIDSSGKSMKKWSFINAYPVKFEVAHQIHHDENRSIETLELAFSHQK